MLSPNHHISLQVDHIHIGKRQWPLRLKNLITITKHNQTVISTLLSHRNWTRLYYIELTLGSTNRIYALSNIHFS